MSLERVIPWENKEWDGYVREHPSGTVYHTSAWCRIVAEAGRYTPLCLVVKENGRIVGLLPAMEIRSRLTGNRMGSLPFSDECYAIADKSEYAHALLAEAVRLRDERSLKFFEMRGAPALRAAAPDGASSREPDLPEQLGFSAQNHFSTYVVPLSTDTEAIRRKFQKKSVRQVINKSFRLGVTVRRGEGDRDLREYYRLYCLMRRGHGVPPQPMRLFQLIFEAFTDSPLARLYMAEFEGGTIGALIVLHYNGTAYVKYEGVDDNYRDKLPIYAMLWTVIEDAALEGLRACDLGRTASDNAGLASFKSHWGTERVELPYFFCPPGEGISVVKSASLKYRLFTGLFRRLPTSMTARLGARLFRHFG